MIAQTSGKQSKAVEDIYQKKSQREHILLRPDSYVGSTQPVNKDMWVYDERKDQIVYRPITYVPGLYKIFGKCRAFSNRVD